MGEEAQQITFSATDLVIPDARESKRRRPQKRSRTSWKAESEARTPEVPTKSPGIHSSSFAPSTSSDLERVKPYNFGLWLKRHPGSAPPNVSTWPRFDFFLITCFSKA